MAEKEREAMQQRAQNTSVTPTQPNMTQGTHLGAEYNSIYPTVPGPVCNPSYSQDVRIIRTIPGEKKSIIEAYLLWIIFGFFGAHHFYLKRIEFGIVYFFSFGLLGCGWVIDMFRMPYLVSQTNKRLTDVTSVKKKNISDAYTLWFPFGLLGISFFTFLSVCQSSFLSVCLYVFLDQIYVFLDDLRKQYCIT